LVIREFIDRNLEPGIYQIADKESLSTKEIIELIGEATSRITRVWKIPPSFINGIAKAGNVFSFPLNSDKLKKLTENYLVSNKKLVDALGVELPIHARDGLKFTLNSLSKNQC